MWTILPPPLLPLFSKPLQFLAWINAITSYWFISYNFILMFSLIRATRGVLWKPKSDHVSPLRLFFISLREKIKVFTWTSFYVIWHCIISLQPNYTSLDPSKSSVTIIVTLWPAAFALVALCLKCSFSTDLMAHPINSFKYWLKYHLPREDYPDHLNEIQFLSIPDLSQLA